MPLGGYVKMLGQEDMDPAARSSHPRSFNSKSVMARFWVLSAGVIMNMIFGAILLAIAFSPWLGVEFPAAVVGGTAPESPAATAYAQGFDGDADYRGLRVGDRIVAINDKPAEDFMDVRLATALGKAGKPVRFEVERVIDGEALRLTYAITPQVSGEEKLLSAGIAMSPSLTVAEVSRGGKKEAGISPLGPNQDAGITAGMRVTEADGQPIDSYGQLYRAMMAAQGRPVSIALVHPETGERATGIVRAVPELTTADDQPRNLLGFKPATVIGPRAKSKLMGKAQAGDILARIDSIAYPTVADTADAIENIKGKTVHVAVLRDGREIDFGPTALVGGKLQIDLLVAYDTAYISGVVPGTPADAMQKGSDPIPPGSRILAVNGEAVEDWAAIQRALAAAAAAGQRSVELDIEIAVVDRPTETMTLMFDDEAASAVIAAGWADINQLGLETLRVRVAGDNVVDAVGIGIEKTHEFMLQTYLTLARLFQGSVKLSHMRGPVGIVDEGTKIASQGFSYLLFFLGLISVNLAVINFLPIPIVDGGHIVFLAIEKIKGSPVGPKMQTYASLAGLAVIGFVFLTTLYYDVGRLGVTDWITGLFGG